MRSRFWRCRTQLIVSGNPSARAARAAAIFLSNERIPAIRSFSSGSGLWIETCTWSRPASLSCAARRRGLEDAERPRLAEGPDQVLGPGLRAPALAADVDRVRAVRAVQRAL